MRESSSKNSNPEVFNRRAYSFDYPEELIAVEPASPRDSSRLLVLRRAEGTIEHRAFSDLPAYLNAGDCLVLNRSKVVPARLVGRKESGGKADLLLVRDLGERLWWVLSPDVKPGQSLFFPGGLNAAAEDRHPEGGWTVRFGADPSECLRGHGLTPLPPYIRRRRRDAPVDESEDRIRYQTVYAREEGSIAAPTAGLHFTDRLLEELRGRGVLVAEVVLHVGLGTFLPVTADDVRRHEMKSESYFIPPETSARMADVRRRGGRIVAVGTTAVRTLEASALSGGTPSGETDIFIFPGHRFRGVDALITNFHQPESTPLLLASAFAGRERLLAAYREAVERRYRLFSFGDSMLIL